jgi:hypothetical protein
MSYKYGDLNISLSVGFITLVVSDFLRGLSEITLFFGRSCPVTVSDIIQVPDLSDVYFS